MQLIQKWWNLLGQIMGEGEYARVLRTPAVEASGFEDSDCRGILCEPAEREIFPPESLLLKSSSPRRGVRGERRKTIRIFLCVLCVLRVSAVNYSLREIGNNWQVRSNFQ